MKVMIDTNILISAVLFPKGRAAEALYKALVSPYQPVICDYIIDELHRKFQEKFLDKTLELYKCHTPESPVLWAFLKLKMPKKAVFCYDSAIGIGGLFINPRNPGTNRLDT
ncbi:MAG: PIN domain-containing protein [Saccharofermentanales bacterium]